MSTGSGPESPALHLVLISGVSGSGKSIALNVLEDTGYTCIDNLPVALVQETMEILRRSGTAQVALSIDARSGSSLVPLPGFVEDLQKRGVQVEVLFLDAKNDVLLRRYSETRRRHPLAHGERTLAECLRMERQVLSPVADIGHRIDTSELSPNQLRDWIKSLLQIPSGLTALLFESFGYKAGIPLDADLVFDVRCLPNPYYDPRLQALTGHHEEVVAYLERDPQVDKMFRDILAFLEAWLPAYTRDNRSYLTVALGCTGGQHRSVYLAERLAAHFRPRLPVLVRHREFPA
jgi:RNase adapter protein RapZ